MRAEAETHPAVLNARDSLFHSSARVSSSVTASEGVRRDDANALGGGFCRRQVEPDESLHRSADPKVGALKNTSKSCRDQVRQLRRPRQNPGLLDNGEAKELERLLPEEAESGCQLSLRDLGRLVACVELPHKLAVQSRYQGRPKIGDEVPKRPQRRFGGPGFRTGTYGTQTQVEGLPTCRREVPQLSDRSD